ncbi:hypothetical protein RM844_11555 [Streptomyces sp. DSM 44915]|uniref:Secreted protein n=1 Tax=Streptomyces chisholmiae TaxID=3075540 RepID=A0ABU2JPL7_9ACTN|nr:hypothetical protein [Streptomyces sp. DSM 44915]MDT0266926.1 hypothetical protein [Streptomyces sp. DSM 44915]
MGTHATRLTATLAVVGALALGAAGCSADGDRSTGRDQHGQEGESPGGGAEEDPGDAAGAAPQLLGDGSTANTGPQPEQPPAPEPLAPGEEPPQFVVFSWDGAGEDANELFSRFRQLGEEHDADMTFFLSGLYLLPESERLSYEPPGRDPGASDIGYLSDESIAATLDQLRLAWQEGNEIGTHFNGHFCGPTGVSSWSKDDWVSEIEQAKWMVQNWRTTTGLTEADPLPFDYDTELVGGRAPCLEGQENLLPAAAEMGFRYDSSGNSLQVWPERRHGIWDISLQSVPMPGHSFETLAMDYNFMVNQSGEQSGDPAMWPTWQAEMHDGLIAAFDRAYEGNRAPLIIGNHFNQWNGGIYMDAVADVITELCPRDGVECVSFRQLVDWLDAQDPEVLDRLRSLGVGQAPPDGWASFLAG